ncbi:MAG: putative signal transducing protein [Coraliomargarita sp.]
MKVIAAYEKPEEAFLAASRLEGSGIRAGVHDAHTAGAHWNYSNAIGGVRLEVPEADAARAREVLGILEAPRTQRATCPHCGSHDLHIPLLVAMGLHLRVIRSLQNQKIRCNACQSRFRLCLV